MSIALRVTRKGGTITHRRTAADMYANEEFGIAELCLDPLLVVYRYNLGRND
jgi:hypothetical protein